MAEENGQNNMPLTAREIALASFILTMGEFQEGFQASFEENVALLQTFSDPLSEEQIQALEFARWFLDKFFPRLGP